MKHVLFITLCGGCLATSGLAAEPYRTLAGADLDRIAAGACVAGTLVCNDTPPTSGPTMPGPVISEDTLPRVIPTVGLIFPVPGFAACARSGGMCSTSSSAAAGN